MRNTIRSLVGRIERLIMGQKAYKWVLRDWGRLGDLDAATNALETMRFVRQIEPQLLGGPTGRRILVIAPHPDDEAIGPGGTLLLARDGGADISVVYVTTGLDEELPARRKEADASCAVLRAEACFLGEPIFALPLEEVAEKIGAEVRRVQPDAVFLPFFLDDNDDHRRVGEALVAAYEKGLIQGNLEIWAYQVYTPLPGNVVVDISGNAEEKRSLIEVYQTQMRRRDWAHFALGLNAFNSRLLQGRADALSLEAFVVLPASDYVSFSKPYFASGQAYYEPFYAGKQGI